MPYTPDATLVTQPADTGVLAATAAAEFRTLKVYLRDIVIAGLALKAPITNAALVTPALGTPTSGNFSTGTFTWPTFNQNTSGNAATATYATSAGTAAAAPYSGLTGAVTTWNQNTTGNAATASAVAVGGITGLGTGVATALAVNVGSAGAPVVLNGAGGTPSSINLANATAYPGTSALTTVGALNSGSITSGFGAIDVGADAISGGAITGTTGTFSGAGTAITRVTIVRGTDDAGQKTHLGYNGIIMERTGVAVASVGTYTITLRGTTDVVPVSITSTGLAVTGTLSATETLTTGSGSTTSTGLILGYSGTSGYSGIWSTGVTPDLSTTYTLVATANGTATYLNAPNASGTVSLQVAGATKGQATSTGFSVTGLLDLSAATAGQIKFPATQNASADANTLDDYEEGTVSSTSSPYTVTTGTSGTITILGQADYDLSYIKIGKQVRICGQIYVSSVSSPVGSAISLNGLPFATASNNRYVGLLKIGDGALPNGIYAGNATASGTTASFYLDASGIAAGSTFLVDITYFTA